MICLSLGLTMSTLKIPFFPSAVLEWSKLNSFIRNSETFMLFKNRLLEFVRLEAISIFNIHNPMGIKYFTRLRLYFSHLKEHKFKGNFQDSVDPLGSCGIEIESMKHFLLLCSNFSIQRKTLFDKLTELNIDVLTRNDDYIVKTLLLVQQDFDNATNKILLEATIDFIIATERFDYPLLKEYFFFFSFLWKSLGIQVYNGRKYPWSLFCVCLFYPLCLF